MRLEIGSPCTEPWSRMRGTGRVRYCGRCRLNVHDLSQMSRREGEELLRGTEGRLCVRFVQRRNGTVLTRDGPGRIVAMIMALIAFLLATGCVRYQGRPAPGPAEQGERKPK